MDPTREELEAMLADYVDGGLAGAELARAETFLAANPGVRDVMGRLMVDSEAIRTLPRVTPPIADVSEDLRGQLERDMLLGGSSMSAPTPRRVSTSALAMAAMIVVGLGAGIVTYAVLANRPEPAILASNLPDANKVANRRPGETAQNMSRPMTAGRSRNASTRELENAVVAHSKDERSGSSAADPTAAADALNAAGGGGGASRFSVEGSALSREGPLQTQSPSVVIDGLAASSTDRPIQVAAGAVPPDVIDFVAAHADVSASSSAARRTIVFVVDADASKRLPADQFADAAATYFQSIPPGPSGAAGAEAGRLGKVSRFGTGDDSVLDSTGPEALANASVFDRSSAALPSAARRDDIVSNATTTTPIASAIAAEAGRVTTQPMQVFATKAKAVTPTGIVARGVLESAAARWQVQTDATLGAGKLIAYVVPADAVDRSRMRPFGTVDPFSPTTRLGGVAPATEVAGLDDRLGRPVSDRDEAAAVANGQLQSLAQHLDRQPSLSSQMSQVSGVPLETQQLQTPAQLRTIDAKTQVGAGVDTVDVYILIRPGTATATAPVSVSVPVPVPATLPTTQP